VPGGVLQDQITAGMMFAASIIWAGALAPIDVTVGAWPKLLDAAAYGRIRDLIAAPPTYQGKLPLPAPWAVCRSRMPSSRFRDRTRRVLRDFSGSR
jgi:ABC-type protease/lipase transport system fused ATPase/permease subunit